MKKWCALILTIVMSFSLVACGGEKQESDAVLQTNHEEVQNEDLIDEQTALMVHICINPEFEMYIGKDEKVQKVVCLNEDANAIIDNVDVEGMSCEDATYLILNETVKQGFLKANDKIEVMVSFSVETAQQMDDWMERVQKSVIRVLEEHDMGAQLVFDSKVVEAEDGNLENPITTEGSATTEAPATTENTEEDLPETTPEELPAETDADGNTIIREENGIVVVVDKDGKLLQITEPDGVVTKMNYDGNGNLTFQEIHDPVGVVTIQRYDNRGQLVSTEINAPDGIQTIMNYDANGNLVSEERILLDQSYSYTYHSNGTVASEIERQASGFTRERYYYENGILSREYQLWANGMYKDDYFDQNGNPTQANFKNAEGGVEERTFNPDGTSYGYYYDPSGSVFYYEFDANGRQLLDTHKQVK